jgi:RNA polymerase sigma factor (sigma-70 family)
VSYTKDTLNTVLLTPTQEQELARAIEAGREARQRLAKGCAREGDVELTEAADAARERFVTANLRLVMSIAWRMKVPAHIDRDDLIQDGMVGLDRAVAGFDWRKGYRFSTYAGWWIHQAMQRGLETTLAPVRIPAYRSGELRAALDKTEGDVSALDAKLARVAMVARATSLDRVVGDGVHTVGDGVAARAAGPEEELERATDTAAVARLLAELDPVTARAVVARFGLDGGAPATFAEIAATLGVSGEAVRRRIQRALRNLRPVAERLAAPETAARCAA